MIFVLLCLTAAFARVTLCQPIVTVWVATVTVPASSPSADASLVPQAVNNEIQVSETQRTSSPTTPDTTITTSESTSSHESGIARESTSSQVLPQVTASPNNEYYEPEVSSSGGIDTEGGASGSGASAFSLSTGGLAAILIVVILVVIFGSKCMRPTYLVLH